jgi:predicted DNA-binding transcriptional regulator AlpA
VNDPSFISRSELCRRWGISRATTYRLQAEGYLKAPILLGPGTARFPVAEIEAIEKRAAEDRMAANPRAEGPEHIGKPIARVMVALAGKAGGVDG